jgi:hypothetical protein
VHEHGRLSRRGTEFAHSTGTEAHVMERRSDISGSRNGLLLATAGVGLCLAARSLVRRSRWMDLRGRAVLITGGSRGLGLLMAREFVQQGARVAICARDGEELDRAAADLTRRGVTSRRSPAT